MNVTIIIIVLFINGCLKVCINRNDLGSVIYY